MGLFGIFSKKRKQPIQLDEISFEVNGRDKFIKNYQSKRVPVLIKGGARDWKLMNTWNKSYISENMGGYVCKIISDSRPAYSKEQTTLKNYFEKFNDYSTLTLDSFDPKKPPLFFNDVEIPNPFFQKKDIQRFFFYHSVKDAGTLPHIHGDAFNILQEGKKHWVLYDASPTLSPNGYKVLQSSNKKYPKGTHAKTWFKRALPSLMGSAETIYSCIQEAGDIVYIPSEYCHAVLNKSEVMGIVFETARK